MVRVHQGAHLKPFRNGSCGEAFFVARPHLSTVLRRRYSRKNFRSGKKTGAADDKSGRLRGRKIGSPASRLPRSRGLAGACLDVAASDALERVLRVLDRLPLNCSRNSRSDGRC